MIVVENNKYCRGYDKDSLLKFGRVYIHPDKDHHHEIVDALNIKDTTADPDQLRFAKVEITPPNDDIFAPVNKWSFRLDEDVKPVWWTDEDQKECRLALTEYMKLVRFNKKTFKTLNAKHRLFLKNCIVERFESGIINLYGSSTVQEMYNSSTVQVMWGSSTVQVMCDSSTVQEMWGSSTVQIYSSDVKIEKYTDNAIVIDRCDDKPIVKGNFIKKK
jgi:hypothetical protein